MIAVESVPLTRVLNKYALIALEMRPWIVELIVLKYLVGSTENVFARFRPQKRCQHDSKKRR